MRRTRAVRRANYCYCAGHDDACVRTHVNTYVRDQQHHVAHPPHPPGGPLALALDHPSKRSLATTAVGGYRFSCENPISRFSIIISVYVTFFFFFLMKLCPRTRGRTASVRQQQRRSENNNLTVINIVYGWGGELNKGKPIDFNAKIPFRTMIPLRRGIDTSTTDIMQRNEKIKLIKSKPLWCYTVLYAQQYQYFNTCETCIVAPCKEIGTFLWNR